jgi:hypothetical protein
MDEGQRLYWIQRGIRGDHARDGAVLVLVCSEVMTSGALSLVGRGGRGSVSIRGGR